MDEKVMQFRKTKIIKTYQKDKFLHSLNRVSTVFINRLYDFTAEG